MKISVYNTNLVRYNGPMINKIIELSTNLAEDLIMTKVIARRDSDTDIRRYTRRDSAVTVLRKMGVDKALYGNFIESVADGVLLNVKAAEKSLAPKTATKTERRKPVSKVPIKFVYEDVHNTPRMKRIEKPNSVAYTIRGLIAEGKSNDEIWKIVQPQFGLTDSKRHYPSWYRAELKRRESK